MRPLLVLGAGEDQLPLYREARRRGLPVIGVDQRADRPGLALADHVVRCSIRHPDAIAAAVAALPGAAAEPRAVVSAASDAGLHSWHELSRRYRAPYVYPLAAAAASAGKAAFHRLAVGAGVPSYRWTDDPTDLTGLRLPVVVKPDDASGSKGTTLVNHPDELPAAVAHARDHSAGGRILVEEYLVGRNLTIELFMRDGRRHFWTVTQKRIVPGPHFVIGGHDCPAPVPAAITARAVELAETLCLAMELRDGPANFDLVVGSDEDPASVRVLEANARLTGNGFPQLARVCRGVDTVAALVSLALGEPFDLTPDRERAAIVHVLASPLDVPGELVAVDGVRHAAALPGIEVCEVYARPGAVVHPFTQSAHKLGYLLAGGVDHAEAGRHLAAALDTVRLTVTATAALARGAAHATP